MTITTSEITSLSVYHCFVCSTPTSTHLRTSVATGLQTRPRKSRRHCSTCQNRVKIPSSIHEVPSRSSKTHAQNYLFREDGKRITRSEGSSKNLKKRKIRERCISEADELYLLMELRLTHHAPGPGFFVGRRE